MDAHVTARLGRLALLYGTRPQIVKASLLAEGLREDWEVLCVDTGQHYDWEMKGLHYEQLGARPPDLFLEVRSGDHAQQTAAVLMRASEALADFQPDVAVVIGDTNSTLGCALAAAKQRIYLVHVEAGLRARDLQMAEEINRRVVDEISLLLCTPSRRSTEYLQERASPTQTVAFTGDVSRDVLEKARLSPNVPTAPWEAHGISRPFALATLHRAELTASRESLTAVLRGLGRLPCSVFFPSHPRTVAAIEQHGLGTSVPANVVFAAPVGYLDLVAWTQNADVVVTDSGGLQREAFWLGVPCITVRGETEWVETVEEGANVLVDPAEGDRLADASTEHPGRRTPWDGDAYGSGRAVAEVREAVRSSFVR